MSAITVRNLPDEVHRALRVRAATHGRSTEAEIRAILEAAVKPAERVRLGSLLAEIGRAVALDEAEQRVFEQALEASRVELPDAPLSFE